MWNSPGGATVDRVGIEGGAREVGIGLSAGQRRVRRRPDRTAVDDLDAGAEFRVFSRRRIEMTAGRSIINNPTRA